MGALGLEAIPQLLLIPLRWTAKFAISGASGRPVFGLDVIWVSFCPSMSEMTACLLLSAVRQSRRTCGPAEQ